MRKVADPDETCDGVAQNDMGICRMDIVDSELGYLGYDSTEAYGVTWKVTRDVACVESSCSTQHAWDSPRREGNCGEGGRGFVVIYRF